MLAVYSVSGVVQAIGMASGMSGSADSIDRTGVAYVLFFLSVAAGYGAGRDNSIARRCAAVVDSTGQTADKETRCERPSPSSTCRSLREV
jgi:hypothetical protein